MKTPERHIAHIETHSESLRRGGSTRTAACSCGWKGPQRATLELVVDDALLHERSDMQITLRERRARTKTRSKAKKAPFPREATLRLASCAILALDTRGRLGVGSGMLVLRDPKTREVKLTRWEEGFFDALDAIGVEYDREAYYAKTARKKKRR